MEQIGVLFVDPPPDVPLDLIPGLLPIEGVTYLTGPTNIGKSLVAIEICSALSTGTRLWSSLTVSRTCDYIAYLLGEHTAGTLQRLYRVTGLPMGQHARIVGPEHLPDQKQLVVKGEVVSEAMEAYQRYVEGAEFIVVDPLGAFISGVNAENDNAAMRHLVDAFSLLGHENSCPVLILGHFGKPMQDKEGGEYHRHSYASRGASAAEDASPTVFYLTEEKDQGYRLRCRKNKGVDIPDRLLLRNAATRVHTLLTSNRPHVEAARLAFCHQVEDYMHDGLSKTSAVAKAARKCGVDRSTAWRYVKKTRG